VSQSSTGSALTENILLLLGSLVFTFVVLAGVEGALRLTGVGTEDASGTSRLKYQQIYLPILDPAARADGTPILRTTDSRLPYQSILTEKTARSLRVFTFGGSAAAGLGYSPNVTFARHLERMLEEAHPDRAVELVNLAIVALSSQQVLLLVEEACRRYEPDLVIVYSGNNEFLEIHAEKYAEANASGLAPLRRALADTNLSRLVNRLVRGDTRTPSMAEQDVSHEDLRLTQAAIIEDVEMTPEEVDEIVARYRANLSAMVDVAGETGTPMILMTVASNWRWRGREDLDPAWLGALLGDEGGASRDRYQRAIPLLTEQIAQATPDTRWKRFYERAVAREALGDFAGAQADYRASMNGDPHLRRALAALADQVRDVGDAPQIQVFDTIAFLADHAEHGIVGFDEFYDYVHFTPRGTVLVAAALFEAIRGAGVATPDPDFDPQAYVARRLARLDTIREDELDVGEWMGIGSDPDRIADRDLWKYDKMVDSLDARIASDPNDLRALVYRGNARYFRTDGGEGAARHYRAALKLDPGAAEVGRNLDRLRSSGRLAETSR